MGGSKKSRIIPFKPIKTDLRQNKHRFQGFHERIAVLKIDPIRTARNQDEKSTESHFRARFDYWKDINLSEPFTEFVREIDPLCDSLTQILYFEQQIVDTIIARLQQQNVVCLEPILDLISQLARDLGHRFEKHYARVISVLATIVSSHQDVEVLEWSFNTLAWMFQFLSKFLVPDLRPTYDVMASLLGKNIQKGHIARFAAEAMSFLLRRAAWRLSRDPEPLELIMKHILKDWATYCFKGDDVEIFSYGLMNLFVDCIKDVKTTNAIRADGIDVFRILVRESFAVREMTVVRGVLINLMHHANSDTFEGLQEVVTAEIVKCDRGISKEHFIGWLDLLDTMIEVRNGRRISNWSSIFASFQNLLHISPEFIKNEVNLGNLVGRTAASLIQCSSFDALISELNRTVSRLLELIDVHASSTFFLFAWDLDSQRFGELLKPFFFKFLAERAKNTDDELRQFFSLQSILSGQETSWKISNLPKAFTQAWRERIRAGMVAPNDKGMDAFRLNTVFCLTHFIPSDSEICAEIEAILVAQARQMIHLERPLVSEDGIERFLFGNGLKWYLQCWAARSESPLLQWDDLLSVQQDFGRMPIYVENLLRFLNASEAIANQTIVIQTFLLSNLATDSSRLRSASARLLKALAQRSGATEETVFDVMINIEDSPLTHASVRSISMHIRRLAEAYFVSEQHQWLREAIVYYCFGLLSLNLTPIWKDASESLRAIYDGGDSRDAQLLEDLVFKWLETRHSHRNPGILVPGEDTRPHKTTEFECTNYQRQTAMYKKRSSDIEFAMQGAKFRFESEHLLIDPLPKNSSSQALRVLIAIPSLAEKRSRRLVPLFLSWASAEDDSDDTLIGDVSPSSISQSEFSGFSRLDKLDMLNVLGFVANPKSLYRANDVYLALLGQLASGDAKTQKAALKALATWKTAGFKIYKENLENLLDSARFREELTMFLPSKMEEKGLNSSDRTEMMRVLLPLLFGRVTAKGKASAGQMTQEARRKAVFETLATFPDQDLAHFLDIALGPLKSVELRDNKPVLLDVSPSSISLRRQAGFVRLSKDMVECVGNKLEPIADKLIPALVFCLYNAQPARGKESEGNHEQVDGEASTDEVFSLKATRRAGLQCLSVISQRFSKHVVDGYINAIFDTIVVPRLGATFIAENAQSISGLFRLFATWASSHETASYLNIHKMLLPQLVDCIHEKITTAIDKEVENSQKGEILDIQEGLSVKTPVKLYIINSILLPYFVSRSEERSTDHTDSQSLEHIISAVISILQKDRSTDLAASAVHLALQVVPLAAASNSTQLMELLLSMLEMPQRQVSLATKTIVLQLLDQHMVHLSSECILDLKTFEILSKQFLVSDLGFRWQLCQTFVRLGQALGLHFKTIAQICSDMNSISSDRLDDPDLAARSRAFEKLLLPGFEASDMQWNPIVHNALYFLKDQEETFVRKNAAAILRKFIQLSVDLHHNGEIVYPTSKTLRGVVLPALRRGAMERNELTRVEYISLMEHLIQMCPEWVEISDLVPLVESADDTESILGGLMHIQQDWRNRSLVKLARTARQGQLGADNIAHFLMPLVEHFVLEKDEDSQVNPLAAQAMTTIGALCLCLDWEQVRKSLRRYIGITRENPDIEKSAIRLVGIVTEAIHKANTAENSMSRLASTIADHESFHADIKEKLLPPIVAFLRHKEESVVSLRVPMAVSAVRLICLLPQEELEAKLAPVLTDVCNILRSKAQESRDLSRKTLAEIAALIGPDRFSFILKELRIALGRGYQLHVKSYTLHSLLVACDFRAGELDYCLSDILRIILDDIFGAVGQEKDADGYTNKAKEVKGSKSLDSAERLARISSIECVKEYITPIRGILMERLDARAVGKVDELLRRVALGLQQNEAFGTQAALIFCYQVLDQTKRAATVQTSDTSGLSREQLSRVKKFEVKIKRSSKTVAGPQLSSQVFKLARFALDLLRTIFQRHEVLRTPSNLAGFLPTLGDILLDAQEEVQISALRLLSSILKVPMKQWVDNIPVYAHTAFAVIQNERDTNTELAQAAIKLITAILRDRQEIDLKDSQIGALVKAIIPDLTQPARQGVTFNLLKAIVARRVINNEIYQAMDSTARLFVTYSDGSARNQARSIWLQFVVGYEQSEKRFNQQISFLAQNLTFEHVEGRQSVMEAIHFLIGKLDADHQQKTIVMLFLPLVDRIIGDEATSCREMASLLLKTMVSLASDENLRLFGKILERLFSQSDTEHGIQTALQIYSIFVESDPARIQQEVGMLIGWLEQTLQGVSMRESGDWETVYAALQLALRLSESFEDIIASRQYSHLWDAIWNLASFPHAWIKGAASKLIRAHLDRFDVSMPNIDLTNTIQSKFGVALDRQKVIDLIRIYFRSLWQEPPEWLVAEVICNLDMLELIADRWQIEVDHDTIDAARVGYDLSGEEDEQDDDKADENRQTKDASSLYFRHISAIMRRDSPLQSKTASLGLLATLIDRLPAARIENSLLDILRPLNHLTDKSITQMMHVNPSDQEKRQALTDMSHEIIHKLQKKMTDNKYIKAMQAVQQEARQKREERRNKRRIEAVSDPAKASKEKMKKRERGRDRKKEINSIHRSRRRGY